MKSNQTRLFELLTIGWMATVSGFAANWPQWRGPNFNGSSSAVNLPVVWSVTENVKWKVEMPGPGAATPIIWENHVFMTSMHADTKDLLAFGFDRETGRELWRRTITNAFGAEERRNTMASPSPITDGQRVYFYFGTGDLVAFDFEGNELWRRNIPQDHGPFNVLWGYASSPLLYDGKLIVPVVHRDEPVDNRRRRTAPQSGADEKAPSYLLAIDPQTGRDIWKQIRESDASGETRESYATPIPYTLNGTSCVLMPGGNYLTANDPASGDELWRWFTYNPRNEQYQRLVPSVVTHGSLIYLSAPKGKPIFALKMEGNGLVKDEAVAWQSDGEFNSDVCTPLVYEGFLYVLDGDGKELLCVVPETGEIKWRGDLGGYAVWRASPTGADGKIYCMNEDGDVVVAAADSNEFRVLSRMSFDESPTRSTIAVIDGRLFIRTAGHLYCIGE